MRSECEFASHPSPFTGEWGVANHSLGQKVDVIVGIVKLCSKKVRIGVKITKVKES